MGDGRTGREARRPGKQATQDEQDGNGTEAVVKGRTGLEGLL